MTKQTVKTALLGPFAFLFGGGTATTRNPGGGAPGAPDPASQAAQDAQDAATADHLIDGVIATAVAALTAGAPPLVGAAYAVPSGGAVAALWHSQPVHTRAQVWRGEVA